MAEEEVLLLTTGLAEEFQMEDALSQVAGICGNDNVRNGLKNLVNESKLHASILGDLVLELPENSIGMEDMDRVVAEKARNFREFRLTSETTSWYLKKVSGLRDSRVDDLLEAQILTKEATISILEIFVGAERRAYSTYAILAPKLRGDSRRKVEGIAKDELRHEGVLRALVHYMKTGEEIKPYPAKAPNSPESIFHCTVCRKLHAENSGVCEICGNDSIEEME